MSCRCEAVHESGYRCVLASHSEETPHWTVGNRHWGGRCKRCGKPAELAHEDCVPADEGRKQKQGAA